MAWWISKEGEEDIIESLAVGDGGRGKSNEVQP